ncbi:MAG: hypothetical protein JSS09_08930, partial [Verrucomicrobia bacterium]|nr:hypothetical protein [Verrucomicrobiota bacterium]
TVLSLLDKKVEIVRPGAISKEQLEEFLQEPVSVYQPKTGEAVISPGMKYRHYAPKAKVTLFLNPESAVEYMRKEPKIKRMVLSNTPMEEFSSSPIACESFYANLRLADRLNLGEVVIVCDETTQKNLGLMNRIEKSSGL